MGSAAGTVSECGNHRILRQLGAAFSVHGSARLKPRERATARIRGCGSADRFPPGAVHIYEVDVFCWLRGRARSCRAYRDRAHVLAETLLSVLRTSAAGGRSAGSRLSIRRSRASNSAGIFARITDVARTVRHSIASYTSSGVSPANGCIPAASSYNTTPNEKTSEAVVAASPRRISGGMYSKVPDSVPEMVPEAPRDSGSGRAGPVSRASPKSRIFTTP